MDGYEIAAPLGAKGHHDPARGAETLRDQAALVGADMIVMGGFVHSRLRELVFGGVTQQLLKSSPVPLFMAH
jgi:nucleotide-binding universal stress UspA family protein